MTQVPQPLGRGMSRERPVLDTEQHGAGRPTTMTRRGLRAGCAVASVARQAGHRGTDRQLGDVLGRCSGSCAYVVGSRHP